MLTMLVQDFLSSFDESRFPPEFLQRYEIMECLAHNEMGETLLVKDRQTAQQQVAKCYSNPSLLAHGSESDLLKNLQHIGLPTYRGEVQNENMRCVLREFAPGTPLDQLAQAAALSQQQALSIAIQLCDILSYLHGQTPPIIHRDIKPQNIIVDQHGKITLIDFGISRTFNPESQADTQCWGTKHYAAPEQYGFSQTTSRSDIFSLGVLLCWMLTGSVNVAQAIKSIPDRWLVKIIKKCTAFAPQSRYRNAAQVRQALSGHAARSRTLAFLGVAFILLVIGLGFANFSKIINPPPARITFQEPRIEQAVRLTLQKGVSEEITQQDLLTITELFVFGDKPAGNEKDFYAYGDNFANNGGDILRGNIRSLADLPKLKNLRRVSLAYQDITDLTPLAQLAALEFVDLRHNPFSDISALAKLEKLNTLTIFDSQVTDLSALQTCPRLAMLDVGLTPITSLAALQGLDTLHVLMIRKSALRSLDGIQNHTLLEEVYLTETQVTDLAPLLDLPRLRMVEVGENMRPAAQAITPKAQFSIDYK